MLILLSICSTGGERLEEAFANAGLGMYNYMTPLTGVEIDKAVIRCLFVIALLLSVCSENINRSCSALNLRGLAILQGV